MTAWSIIGKSWWKQSQRRHCWIGMGCCWRNLYRMNPSLVNVAQKPIMSGREAREERGKKLTDTAGWAARWTIDAAGPVTTYKIQSEPFYHYHLNAEKWHTECEVDNNVVSIKVSRDVAACIWEVGHGCSLSANRSLWVSSIRARKSRGDFSPRNQCLRCRHHSWLRQGHYHRF